MNKEGGEYWAAPSTPSAGAGSAVKIHLNADQKKQALAQEKESQDKAKRDAKVVRER